MSVLQFIIVKLFWFIMHSPLQETQFGGTLSHAGHQRNSSSGHSSGQLLGLHFGISGVLCIGKGVNEIRIWPVLYHCNHTWELS